MQSERRTRLGLVSQRAHPCNNDTAPRRARRVTPRMSVPRQLLRVIGRGQVGVVLRCFSSTPIRPASAPSDPAPVPHVTNAWRNYGIAGARVLCVLQAMAVNIWRPRSPARFKQMPILSLLPSPAVSVCADPLSPSCWQGSFSPSMITSHLIFTSLPWMIWQSSGPHPTQRCFCRRICCRRRSSVASQ